MTRLVRIAFRGAGDSGPGAAAVLGKRETPSVSHTPSSVAVLASGGLDSAVLLAELAESAARVYPLYLRAGLYWEPVELMHLQRFLQVLARPAVQPLVVLDACAADLYGRHWSLTGQGVPDDRSPDEAVYLPGRNLLLVSKALVWCHLQRVPALALATLQGNPFPDATDEFFQHLEAAANRGLADRLTVLRPYAQLTKQDVLERGAGLPLQHTFSCIRPLQGQHCGQCNKCAERRRVFTAAGRPDPTPYSTTALSEPGSPRCTA
jgi:7-cyano-7-deazaguanine synthase